jgi:hypothetical protein
MIFMPAVATTVYFWTAPTVPEDTSDRPVFVLMEAMALGRAACGKGVE